jgi:hypothetical protein
VDSIILKYIFSLENAVDTAAMVFGLVCPEIEKSLPKSSLSILLAVSKSLAALCKLNLGTQYID